MHDVNKVINDELRICKANFRICQCSEKSIFQKYEKRPDLGDDLDLLPEHFLAQNSNLVGFLMGIVVVHIPKTLHHSQSKSQAVPECPQIFVLRRPVSFLQIVQLAVQENNLLTGRAESPFFVNQFESLAQTLLSRSHLEFAVKVIWFVRVCFML